MSRVCEICGKRKASGNNVTFSHRGIRRTWTPNLRKVRVYDENGTPTKMNVCTRCLRSGKVNRVKPGSQTLIDHPLLDEAPQVEDQLEEAVEAKEEEIVQNED